MDENMMGEQTSFEELLRTNRDYQSAFDKKVDKALQTARANWERERDTALESQREAALQDARAAAAAEIEGRQAELDRREADFAHRQRQMEVADRLLELGLPARFAPWLTGSTAEESFDRVAQFDTAFRAAVCDSVTSRMGADVPAEPAIPAGIDREAIRGMTAREINAHWDEIQHTLKGEH